MSLKTSLPRESCKVAVCIVRLLRHGSNLAGSNSNFTITIDEKLSRIIVVYDGVVVLRGDPEHKRIFVRAVRVATKDLGVGAEQMRQEEYISDPSPVVMRMMELGMDPRKLAFNP